MRFNSFNEVVSWYERTKPMVSKHHDKGHDVRPINDRKRKWERIKKIDDNTYALLDGNYGRTIWGAPQPYEQHEFENTMAPIVWMRREDGDFIRIRNHTKNNISVTRYNFLAYNLPTTMAFQYNQQGKHWVRTSTPDGYENFQLPKCDVKLDHKNKILHDDNMFLLFKVNNNGTFTRVGDKLPVEVKKVNKEVKTQWRQHVDNFYTYCATIAPMIDTSWGGRHDYTAQLREYLASVDMLKHGMWVNRAASIPQELMRDVVAQEDHPMRVAVAALVIYDIDGKREVKSQDDVRSIRAAYNRVMNQAMGFYKIEKV